jgi:hypothetical protein
MIVATANRADLPVLHECALLSSLIRMHCVRWSTS